MKEEEAPEGEGLEEEVMDDAVTDTDTTVATESEEPTEE